MKERNTLPNVDIITSTPENINKAQPKSYAEYPIYIFDIETNPNYFLIEVEEDEGTDKHSFILDKNNNDIEDIYSFFSEGYKIVVSYNGKFYDDLLIGYILNILYPSSKELTGEEIALLMYQLNEKIFESGAIEKTQKKNLERQNPTLSRDISKWRWRTPYPSNVVPADLKQITVGLRNGEALKDFGVSIGYPNFETLPIEPGTILTEKEKVRIQRYCKKDVALTSLMLKTYRDVFSQVISLADEYGKPDFLRETSSGVADTLLLSGVVDKQDIDKKKTEIKSNKRRTTQSGYHFDFSRDIFSFISFENEENQRALETLKSHPPINCFLTKNDRKRLSQKLGKPLGVISPSYLLREFVNGIPFYIDGDEAHIGVGGFHFLGSVSYSLERCALFDVAAYYPTLFLMSGKYPIGMTKKEGEGFLSSYRELYEKKKVETNDVKKKEIKLKLNSTYGRLETESSWLFYPGVRNVITLNGQLFLLMVMEKLSNNGFDIIGGDTDGIDVIVGDRLEEANRLIEETTALTDNGEVSCIMSPDVYDGFSLFPPQGTSTSATGETSSNIVRYGYNKRKEGRDRDYKKKDWGNYLKPSADVIFDAVIEYIKTDGKVSLEDTISSCKELDRFVFLQKKNKGTTVWLDDKEVFGSLRYYHSTNGQKLYTGKNKKKLVGNVSFVNDVEDVEWSDKEGKYLWKMRCPDDIDIKPYLLEAADRLERVLKGKSDGNDTIKPKALEFSQRYNRKVFPAGGWLWKETGWTYTPKKSPNKKKTEEQNWKGANGYKVETGKTNNTLGIDIDKPELFPKDLLCWIKPNTLISHHLKTSSNKEILEGKAKGTLIFSLTDEKWDELGSRHINLNDKFGFEILGKEGEGIQLSGRHQDGYTYKWNKSGEIQTIPEELYSFILEHKPEEKERIQLDITKKVKSSDVLEKIALNVSTLLQQTDEIHIPPVIEPKDDTEYGAGYVLKTNCPNSHLHSNPSTETDYNVFINQDGSIVGSCGFHTSCKEENKKWWDRISPSLYLYALSHQPKDDIHTNSSILEVLRQKDIERGCILAQTGSGKTYSIAERAVEILNEDLNSLVVIILTNKKAQKDFVDTLGKFYDGYETNWDKLGVFTIQGGSKKSRMGKYAFSKDKIPDNSRCLVMLSSHFTRRGISNRYYKWFGDVIKLCEKKNGYIFGDEADSILNGWKSYIEINPRYYKHKDDNESGYEYTPVCPAKTGSGDECDRCKIREDATFIETRRDKNTLVKIPLWNVVTNEDRNDKSYTPVILPKTDRTFYTKQNKVSGYNNIGGYANVSTFTPGDTRIEPQEYVEYVMENDTYITQYQNFPTLGDKQLTQQEVIEWNKTKGEDNTERVSFPTRSCESISLISMDETPLNKLKDISKQMFLLTGTLSTDYHKLLTDWSGDKPFSIHQIPTNEDRKVDNVVLITIGKTFDKGYFSYIPFYKRDVLWMLFERKLSQISPMVEKLIGIPHFEKKDEIDEYYSWDKTYITKVIKGEISRDWDKETEDEKTPLYITYPLGSEGKGRNHPEYHIIAKSQVYKPIYSFLGNVVDEFELKDKIEEDKNMTITQVIGRNLRRKEGELEVDENSANRLTIVDMMSEEEGKSLADSIRKSVKGEVIHLHLSWWNTHNVLKEILPLYEDKDTSFDKVKSLVMDEKQLITDVKKLLGLCYYYGLEGKTLTQLKKEYYVDRMVKRKALTKKQIETMDKLYEGGKQDRVFEEVNNLLQEGVSPRDIKTDCGYYAKGKNEIPKWKKEVIDKILGNDGIEEAKKDKKRNKIIELKRLGKSKGETSRYMNVNKKKGKDKETLIQLIEDIYNIEGKVEI